ncbi:MAG: hypothetical protein ACT4QG_01645 [Sporichthyaceae bacterium]
MLKALLRRYTWQIAGVTGAAFLLSGLSMVMVGADSPRTVTAAAAALSSPAPSASVHQPDMDKSSAEPSAEPTASPSAEPSPTSIDAVPAVVTTDQVNTALGLAIAAIVLSLVATGLAGLALARQPSENDVDEVDIAG